MKTVKNPKVNLDKILITYQYRVKDSNKKLIKSLMHKSGLVNLVWNYCNDTQQQAVKRCRPWLSAFDLSNLTSGTSKEIDLHSASIQAVCEEYATRRSQFNKPFLKFRTNKKDKNLAKTNNQLISSKKIKIEHVFAYMKNFRILQRLHYYKMNKIELFFQSIANIYNLSKI